MEAKCCSHPVDKPEANVVHRCCHYMEHEFSKIESLEKKVAMLECKVKRLEELEDKVRDLEVKILTMEDVVADGKIRIGRWSIEASCSGELVFRDTESAEGKRYAFPVGGNADMYTSGTGGEIGAKKIVFPTRWSIGEESVSYLVFRDRGCNGQDKRYAMAANVYRDV